MSKIYLKKISKDEKIEVAPRSNILNREIELFSKGLSQKDRESLYVELYNLVSAGLDIRGSLDLIEKQPAKKRFKEIVGAIKEALVNGDSLSEAMKNSGQFKPNEYYSVQIGEETGQITQVFDQLAKYYSTRLKQQRKLASALSYPAVVVITAFGAVSFMLYFIVPMFTDIFQRFGGELPRLTKVIISLSEWFSSNLIFILLLPLLIAIIIYFVKDYQWVKAIMSKVIVITPYLGPLIISLHMSRFCQSMALLTNARVPLIRSLELAKQMTTFYPISHSLIAIEQSIMKGSSLNQALDKFSIYDKKMVALIGVGEEVNKLEVFFHRLSEQYTQEVEYKTDLLNTFLEPLLIIFLGIVVGFILVAMYLPMFELSTSIGAN
jgi:type IV pilus assembly protein PilC